MSNPNIRMIQKVQPGYFVLHVTTQAPDEALEVGAVTPEAMTAAIDKLEKAGVVDLQLTDDVAADPVATE